MSLHPKDVMAQKSKPAPRVTFVWKGVMVQRAFTRRPRVLRLEVSKPKGSSVGEAGI